MRSRQQQHSAQRRNAPHERADHHGTDGGRRQQRLHPGDAIGGCTGDTRNVIEGSIGFWYRLYNGPMGRTQIGMQYSNFVRNTWDGNNNNLANPLLAPHADQNMWFTSFRYYLP